ncbi:FadR/GntR family transcriptional regulator [Sphingomonas aracearum]|uniref:FadR family transcriptional regulator n=1 Tax=Sphingomonas aracearum TaxID=2283317 RepID=A0A369W1J8_9SPHN|nr:FadR/GntR family transcriptional regulator [Sphingomonas aracearum]RDE07230.1 FadR family transcriptional regulator [Sphingomonas aracearum]
MTATRRNPQHVLLSRELGVAIVTGTHPPGTLLPGEVEIAERRGISRSVVREALRMLSAKGLLQSRPKAGTRVRERVHWNLLDPDLLAWMFEGTPPPGFVRSLFELRLIVEPAAAELAARHRTGAQLSRLGHALERMGMHGLATPEGQAADQEFHTVLLEATGNELLLGLASSIAAAVRWTTFFKYRASRQPRDPMPAHRALFEAIAAGDEAAANAATATLIRQAQADTEAALDG